MDIKNYLSKLFHFDYYHDHIQSKVNIYIVLVHDYDYVVYIQASVPYYIIICSSLKD